jgi:hypothetical protein
MLNVEVIEEMSGQVRSFVNIFLGNDDIRNLQQGETAVREDSVISIVPAIAGGSRKPKAESQKGIQIQLQATKFTPIKCCKLHAIQPKAKASVQV